MLACSRSGCTACAEGSRAASGNRPGVELWNRSCKKTMSCGGASPRPRPGDPRGAGAAQHALRQTAGAALPGRQRVLRRPAPGRQPRPAQRRRSLRPRARHPLHRLRLADHPRRAQTPLPRPGLDRAGAARPARPHGRSRQSDHRADQAAAALALGRRDRRAAGGGADRRARGDGGKPQPPARSRSTGRQAPRTPRSRRRPSGSARRTRASSWSRAGSPSTRRCPTWTSASGWCCACASPRT